MQDIIYDFFIRFYDRSIDSPLAERTITQEMFESFQISIDYSKNSLKTMNMVLKNPNNIFSSDSPDPSNANLFGDFVLTDWADYFIPDGEFFIAKGTPEDFDAAEDVEKDKRLLGIFRIDEPSNDMIGQKLTVKCRDTMKFAQVAVAYTYPNEFKYPPPNWAEECLLHPRESASALMSVGQIVHDIFHKMGVYHLHKDTTIDNNQYGSLWDDGTIFWSTNMYFDAANASYANEQIFNLISPYDFINKFVDYTGYRFYVWDTIVNGIPRPVYVFKNPNYDDKTSELFDTSDILYYNQASTVPPIRHRYPIMTLGLIYKKSDADVRGYIFVATKDEAVIVENTGDSGENMEWKKWRVGVVVEPSIVKSNDLSYAEGIAQSIMNQSMHNYRDMSIIMNDFVKFGNKVYNFNIVLTEPYIKITSLYLCKSVNWTWQNGNAYTTADFGFFETDTPIEILLTGHAGESECDIQWTQLEGVDSYTVLRDDLTLDIVFPVNKEPITWQDQLVTNGVTYKYEVIAFFISGTSKTSNALYLTPMAGVIGGGGGRPYLVQ